MVDGEPHAWFGGRIFTGRRWAEALAVENGRVTRVGTDAEVRREVSIGAERTDLRGRLVVPGLADPHLHWLGSIVDAAGIDLRGTRSIAAIQLRVATATRNRSSGPVLGSGWDQERLDERRYPDRSDLDQVESRRPVVLYRVCHHAAVVNSAALDALDIGRATPDPPGGRIGRDAAGDPNGLLFDRAMQPLHGFSVTAFRARATEAGTFLETLVARGLTSIGAMSAVPGEMAMADELADAGPVPVRLRFHCTAERWDGRAPPPEPDPAKPRLIGLKVVLDGSLGARTAWLGSPYADAPSDAGMPIASRESAMETVQAAAERGIGVAMHAIGDRAVEVALDVIEGAPPGTPPLRIEHASVLSPRLVERLAHRRPVLVVQPAFVASDTWVNERLGPTRARWAYPFRELMAAGVTLAGSSDAPIESFDPWMGMEIACRLRGLSATEAVQLYTLGGAAALQEPAVGNLEPGGYGDLVILDAPDLETAIAAHGPVAEVWANGGASLPVLPPSG